MKIYSSLAVGLLFTFLFSSIFLGTNPPSESFCSLGEILNEVALEAKSKYELRAIGTSVASPNGVLKKAGIHFEFSQQLSKQEFRLILHNLTDLLINKINKNHNLRLSIENYPFTASNIDITIFINKDDDNDFYYPDLSIASLKYGVYVFKTNDPDSKYGYKTWEEEEYKPDDFK